MEPTGPDILDARRAPRVPVRLAIELRHRREAWRAETDDVGPRGCQVVSSRVLAAGRDVELSIDCPRLGRSVEATGRVKWSRPEAPSRLGISFEVAIADRGWFHMLLLEDPEASRAALRATLRLPRSARLHLGEPPATVLDFTWDELEVLRAIGPGATVGSAAEALAERFQRARGALFSLLGRGLVLLEPGPAVAPVRWRRILFPEPVRGGLEPPPRPPDAQRLYAEGVAHLGAGRVPLALARFREALELVPGDPHIATTLARLERFQ